jgi:hypothetical protein
MPKQAQKISLRMLQKMEQYSTLFIVNKANQPWLSCLHLPLPSHNVSRRNVGLA